MCGRRLIGVRPGEHVLVLVLHHIATDGWSMGVLARDLSAAYAARRYGRAPGWAPLPVQYADYALWQRELLGAEDDPGSADPGSWGTGGRRWPGCPAELVLPADRPRPAAASHRGQVGAGWGYPAAHAGLADLAARAGRTVFMVLQAALAVLLSRLGAGDDIPVGTAVAGRTDAAAGRPGRVLRQHAGTAHRCRGDPAFTELLGRVRETALGAYAHQDVPFERLVEELAPARSLARHPLFQVMLTFQNIARRAAADWDLPGLRAYPVQAGTGAGPVRPGRVPGRDGATPTDGPAASAGRFDYGGGPVRPGDRARRWRAGWRGCWSRWRLTRGSGRARWSCCRRTERRQVVAGWNDTAAPVPAGTVPELFAAQAARTPDAVAVVCGGTLSYAGLDAASDRLARVSGGAGCGPGDGWWRWRCRGRRSWWSRCWRC